jgi:hypothetical protein
MLRFANSNIWQKPLMFPQVCSNILGCTTRRGASCLRPWKASTPYYYQRGPLISMVNKKQHRRKAGALDAYLARLRDH